MSDSFFPFGRNWNPSAVSSTRHGLCLDRVDDLLDALDLALLDALDFDLLRLDLDLEWLQLLEYD